MKLPKLPNIILRYMGAKYSLKITFTLYDVSQLNVHHMLYVTVYCLIIVDLIGCQYVQSMGGGIILYIY